MTPRRILEEPRFVDTSAMQSENLPELVHALAAAAIEGHTEAASRLLSELPRSERLVWGRRPLLAKEQLRVFRRDRFLCRYCGKRTLFIPVLRALSALYPEELPYHPHGRWESTHPVYWIHGCSCDPVLPVCRGGASGAANLVTACYQCHSIKQHWLLEELRWELLPPPAKGQEWDGLSGLYLDLCRVAPVGGDRYHFAWTRAVSEQPAR